MSRILALQQRLATWCKSKPLVARAWIFGSRARGEARDGSDIDIAIELDLTATAGVDDSGGLATWMFETQTWETELSALLPFEVDLEQYIAGQTPSITAALDESSVLAYQKS
ncbi:MAG: nucleotidyltransferase domain-containing protein [Rhizobacter sp.]|nr:nucleotidyltransferase domain-containing protein [Burkholderiaceae bacterium]MCO5123567.1 nucleotidyltransferase domain-containing protein [Rhizobacter sp.]